MKTLVSFAAIFLSTSLFAADDGLEEKFNKVQMNINDYTYILFEDEALIVCDRYNDAYLMEITPTSKLYVRGKRVDLDSRQSAIVSEYYKAMRRVFGTRNSIGAKGVEVGLAGAGLAVEAVGGALELAFSGFDEKAEREFEERIEREAEKLEQEAESIEKDAEEYEEMVDEANYLGRKLKRDLPMLDEIDLYIDKNDI